VSPIVWELGLVIVGVVGFAVWQFTTLKRDMRITQEEKRRREARAAGEDAAPTGSDPEQCERPHSGS
jgi:hypothetical protein